ncbi:hypothetical protein WJX72_008103 [[Myrmecia] bisecta]|uniref:Uncharacterized protein n=1 Tax=[Myrmecia] bisecta TaxID=41462 RepID=A0AAW1QFL8_9CHLO
MDSNAGVVARVVGLTRVILPESSQASVVSCCCKVKMARQILPASDWALHHFTLVVYIFKLDNIKHMTALTALTRLIVKGLRLHTAPAQCLRAGASRFSSGRFVKGCNFERCAAARSHLQRVFASMAGSDDLFCNRTKEMRHLRALLQSPPPKRTGITVIVGPPSSGKTALIPMGRVLSAFEQALRDSKKGMRLFDGAATTTGSLCSSPAGHHPDHAPRR